jgi:gliding motility-associated-like protein
LLTVTDNIGCTDSIGLQTIPPAEIFIPNSFTPNGDGINDLFGIKGANLVDFEMRIFDRWGKQVFHSADPDKKWNGSHNDGSYHNQTTTYTYLIKYRGIAEEDATELTGQVTVIR